MNPYLITRLFFWCAFLFVGLFIVPIVNNIIYKKQRKKALKFYIPLMILIIFSGVLPIVTINTMKYSQLQLMLEGNYFLVGMLLCYCLAVFLTLLNKPRLDIYSSLILLAGVLLNWMGTNSFEGELINNEVGIYGDLVFFLLIIAPLIALCFSFMIFTISAYRIDDKDRIKKNAK